MIDDKIIRDHTMVQDEYPEPSLRSGYTSRAIFDGCGHLSTTDEEVIKTVTSAEVFSAKFGRKEFRLNFNYDGTWQGKKYSTKQVEAYADRNTAAG